MVVTYTTAALIAKGTKWMSAALVTADIEEYIYEAEGVIDGVMKKTGRGVAPDFTFDSDVHGVIRDAATSLALFNCIRYDPGEFPILEQAELTENLAYYSALRALTLLRDTRIVEYVVGMVPAAVPALEYSSAALVQKGTKWLSSDLLTADIEEYVYEAEGVVDAVMRKSGRTLSTDFTFSGSLHGVIRDATTSLALFNCIRYDPGAFPSLEQAEMTENLAYYSALRALTLLSDVRVTDYVIALT